ncbi:MAG: ABC transporter permease [Pseudomonadota bacterium]
MDFPTPPPISGPISPPYAPGHPLEAAGPAPRSSAPRAFPAFRAIGALMLREIATSYGRTRGGYLWAVAEPVAGIALLSAIFSAAFEAPALGLSFALFYATGMVPFAMFNALSQKLAQAVNFSRQLLAYPAVTFIDALAARFLLNLITELVVALVVLAGILAAFETRVILDFERIAAAFALTAALGCGIGTLNCYLFLRVPAWQQVWSIAMKPMFVISCVFFLFDDIPEPYRSWLWWNPLVHVIGLLRAGFYGGYDALYAAPPYVAGIAGGTLIAGLALLRRDARALLAR